MGDVHLTPYTEMSSLTVGYRGCQRHRTGKDSTKKSPVRIHYCWGSQLQILPRNPWWTERAHPNTRDWCRARIARPKTRFAKSSVFAERVFHAMWKYTWASAALLHWQEHSSDHRNIPWKQPQRSSLNRSRWPQYRGEEGNYLQGSLQKSRLSASETPVWGSLIT